VLVLNRGNAKQYAKQALRRTVGEPYVGKRLKLRRLPRAMKTLDTPRSILDAGAEDATFVYWLADRYPEAQVTAVDIDAAAIAACLEARPSKYADRVHFRVSYFADLEPGSFDLVTAFDVLEHIDDDLGAARDLYAALRPGGTLLVHVPRDRWLTRDGTVHRVPDEDAWQINAGHVRTGYSPERMRALLTDAGFRVLDVQTWVGRWGTLAHSVYSRLEHPTPLRALSLPVTDVCAWLDARNPDMDGNTVFAWAEKPAR
jgi:SAM-dependent methyltransferase